VTGFQLVEVGTVEEMPGETGRARVRIDPAFAAALQGIEEFEHVWILFWLDRVTGEGRRTLRTHPMGDASRPMRGVFALRSPRRPNPIGLTRVRLLAVEGSTLTVEGLDALPGTPVIDIKPATEDRPTQVDRQPAG